MSTLRPVITIPQQLAGVRVAQVRAGTKIHIPGREAVVAGGEELEPGERIAVYADERFVIVDRDLQKGVDRIAEFAVDLPRTFTVSTPSGGSHHYYRQNPGCVLKTKHFRALDVVATRNNYVCFGAGYMLADEVDIAVLPLDVAMLFDMTPSEVEGHVVSGEYAGGNDPGNQDVYLRNLAWNLVGSGMDREEVCSKIREAMAALPLLKAEPWTEDDVQRLVGDEKRGAWYKLRIKAATCEAHTYEDSSKCELPSVEAMSPKEIIAKRHAEAVHVMSRNPKRREMSAPDWHGSPAGCWNFYDLLMMRFQVGADITAITAWVVQHDPDGRFLPWLLSNGLMARLTDGSLAPMPDPRVKCEHGKLDCWCKRFPGWKEEWGDPEAGANWTAEEGRKELRPIVLAAITAGNRLSRGQFAKRMQHRAHELGKHAISRTMAGTWLKQLEGYRREKVPGSKKTYIWVYNADLAEIHAAEKGFSYRRGHMWAYYGALYEAGPDPEHLTHHEEIWAKRLVRSASR